MCACGRPLGWRLWLLLLATQLVRAQCLTAEAGAMLYDRKSRRHGSNDVRSPRKGVCDIASGRPSDTFAVIVIPATAALLATRHYVLRYRSTVRQLFFNAHRWFRGLLTQTCPSFSSRESSRLTCKLSPLELFGPQHQCDQPPPTQQAQNHGEYRSLSCTTSFTYNGGSRQSWRRFREHPPFVAECCSFPCLQVAYINCHFVRGDRGTG